MIDSSKLESTFTSSEPFSRIAIDGSAGSSFIEGALWVLPVKATVISFGHEFDVS